MTKRIASFLISLLPLLCLAQSSIERVNAPYTGPGAPVAAPEVSIKPFDLNVQGSTGNHAVVPNPTLVAPFVLGPPGSTIKTSGVSQPAQSMVVVLPKFDTSPGDRTVREALVRWAGLAKWTHEPVHWTVPVDLSINGTAEFGYDFKTSVRSLLSASEMSGAPLQPCFYSNMVLRVVPKAELCDRTAGPSTSQSSAQ